jgi:predicted permease
MQGSAKFYGWLVRIYPARFREEYRVPMERQFLDEYREAGSRWRRARLWLDAIQDLATTAPGQILCELRVDLTHAIRLYRKRSGSMALAVAALALAIGASTGVFSVLSALLLRSLPFSNPAQLAELWLSPVSALNGRAAFTAWYRSSPYLESAAALSSSEVNLARERDAFRIRAAETSSNFFRLLGTNPVVGRTFAPDEDIPGHNAVAVISYSLWQQLFGGDPDVAGKDLRVNGARLTVIGVAPASFDYPGKTAIWMPTVFDFEKVPKRGAFFIQTIGRLRQGVTIRAARELFEAEAQRAHPEVSRTLDTREQNRPRLVSLQDQLAGDVRKAIWVLAGMTLLVLLTACANVAQLLLSRATERRQELALRTALGASRGRLVQQMTTEATFLTMAAAGLGLLVAHWASRVAASVAPAQLATQEYTLLDWRVLGFAIALAMAIGIVFGVLPTWFVGRLQPSGQGLRIQRGTPEAGTKRARAGLVAMQTALSVCLVTSSLALGITFLNLLNVNLGFQPASVVTLNVSLQGTKHRGPAEWQYYSDALNRLRAVPGVEVAGAVGYLPLANNIYMAGNFKLDSGQTAGSAVVNAVTHDYFRAMGTGFLAGRDFAEHEMQNTERSVIVNEAFAQSVGLGSGIIGRRIKAWWSSTPYTVAGVIATTRPAGPASSGGPQIYWPIEEEPPAALTFVARVRGQPEEFLARCRDAVRTVDPQVPIYDVKTLDQRLADVLSRPRFYATATFFLAVLAILLAAVGIYGTAAYSIAQRRHEIGVRMAVGASHRRVRGMLLSESLAPIVFGTVVGIAFSILLGRYLEHLIEAAAQPALWASTAAAGFLLAIGVATAWSATAGVLSVEPVDALRAE